MKKFECEKCQKMFTTKGNLSQHVNGFCKIIRENKIIEETNKEYVQLRKDYEELLEEKNKISKEKEQNNLQKRKYNKKLKDKNNEIIQENRQLKLKNEDLVNELQELKLQLIKLQTENEIYKKTEEKQFNVISGIANKPTTVSTTTNNSYKNKLELTFDLNDIKTTEYIQKRVNEGFEKEHFMNGQKGVAKVLIKEVFDNNGNKMYICSDYARGMFKFKDKNGNVVVDNKAMKLTDIVYNGVKEKMYLISRECMENEKDVDVMMSISNNIMDIKKMTEDNCDFRNEILKISN